jgi:histidyl-tRNA synthetase
MRQNRKMRFQAQRGTQDVLPDTSYRWQHLEKAFANLVHLYGYREIRTPTFEDTDLFVRSSGETSDIVTKQMYSFNDKGDRNITLKPEGTAPAMRALIEHNLCPAGTIQRLYYVTPIFRYERPQKGRLREAHQVGLELVGSSASTADAEVIEVTVRFYEALGIKGLSVLLNSLGRDECRAKYRQAILDYATPFLKTQPDDVRAKAEKNPLRLLDSKDPDVQDALKGAPVVTAFLEDESKRRFDELQELLTEAGVCFTAAPDIVRGLDYYTETVFEVQSTSLGAQSALCGGGRYDDLVKELGGSPTPSVGVAMGIERALMVMEAEGIALDPPKLDVFIVVAGPSCDKEARRIAAMCRSAGLAAQIDVDARSLKSQLKQADRSGARYAVIIGDDELTSGTVTLRDLGAGEQRPVPAESLMGALTAQP